MNIRLNKNLKKLLTLLTATLLLVGLAASCDSGEPPGGDGGFGRCSAGLKECGPGVDGCKNLTSDANNCGSCGNACAVGSSCENGSCSCIAPLLTCAGGVCANAQADPANCGACGNACAPGLFCSLGQCAEGCDAGLAPCGQSCVDTNADILNCGACGTPCGAGQECRSGLCFCTGEAQLACSTGCTDIRTDVSNCGACGNVCAPGQLCQATQCVGGDQGAGGTAGAGGSAAGGTAGTMSVGGAGGTGNGGNPPGYWTSGSWFGCTWTGIDTVAGTTTTNMPQDFLTHVAGEPYQVSGTVHGDYDSVALLGFNLAELAEGADCSYKPLDPMAVGPPGVTLGGTGIAIAFGKRTGATLRIQLQGPTGAFNPDDRWCATINEAIGPVHVPYSRFNTQCWEGGMGTTFNPANSPVSAISFLVPGEMGTPTEFDYCIFGFAEGTGPGDAPPMGECGPISGTIGGGPDENLDFQRVKVVVDGKSYIIQNNNWGNPADDQTLSYLDNSFTIEDPPGGSTGNGVPASFPSIFIGANGDTQSGRFTTRENDNLPMPINQIQSAITTFRYNRNSGGYNAVYDVWFAAGTPPAQYDDGVSGFVMLWLYDPGNAQPIGSDQGDALGLGGHDWDVWVGPRDPAQPNARPVVSYVIRGSVTSMVDFDLKAFMVDAGKYGIDQGWNLTDVFTGFEIWDGNGTQGLSVQEFKINIQ